MRIARVTEADFDRLVIEAGGQRSSQDASAESTPNADYVLGNAILELKLIEEEGLEKRERQRKIAGLFRDIQPEHPVVVLDPDRLDAQAERRYLNILAGPIQTAVKKGAQQLQSTRGRGCADSVRVLVTINNGYTALSHDEFVQVVLKSARNDTSNIDSVIIAGVYHYTDEFDSCALFPFEEHPITVSSRFREFERLRDRWSEFANEVMTAALRNPIPADDRGRLPVVDIAFDVDSITFVKPAPKMGAPSEFWQNGRPRRNSTGVRTCPPIASTLPDINGDDWEQWRSVLPSSRFLRTSYAEWVCFRDKELAKQVKATKPVVPVPISCDSFIDWCQRRGWSPNADRMFAYALHRFNNAARSLILDAKSLQDTSIIPARYIFVETHEIGQDKAYDFSSIALVTEMSTGQRSVKLVSFERIFHEHALALGAAYALKHGAEIVIHNRVQTYAWV